MFESADVSLVFCFFDIPRGFIHKLRAFIGVFPNRILNGC